MSKTQVIIVAAGLGTRFKSAVPKPFVLLGKKTILSYSLNVFERCAQVDGVIIVGHRQFIKECVRIAKPFKKIKQIVSGGATRADSVKAGLACLDADTGYVLVHDAARPFVDSAMISRLIGALKTYACAIVGIPVKATIKRVSQADVVLETPPRDVLREIQTPQAFRRQILVQAHQKPFKGEATDDAVLVEALGQKVKIVMGSYKNIKITTPEDLEIAKQLLG